MKPGRFFLQRPLLMPLAIAATVIMVTISETAYWQSVATVAAWAATQSHAEGAALTVHHQALLQTLLLARWGVAGLSLICLVALFITLRQGLVLQQHRSAVQAGQRLAHEQLEAVVTERTAQLVELTHHLQTAREDERSRLARDLHDELGALLTSAKLDAARIRSRLAGPVLPPKEPAALERLAHLVQTLDSVIALKRRITEDLHPSSLVHLGLVATLEIRARDLALSLGIPVHCELQTLPLPARAQLMVYRLVQEAFTNIGKHAQASQVWLGLRSSEGAALLEVRDDGVGFDPANQRPSTHGLVGMRYRVLAEHGTLQLTTGAGIGTQIAVRLPLVAAVAAAAGVATAQDAPLR